MHGTRKHICSESALACGIHFCSCLFPRECGNGGPDSKDPGMLTLSGPEMSGSELVVEVVYPRPTYPDLMLHRMLEYFIEF